MRFSSLGKTAAGPGHSHSIKLKLRDMSQLFNSMDPSPFIEKDLDDDAEEFIMSWAQEFPFDSPVKLRIYLEQWPTEDPNEPVCSSVWYSWPPASFSSRHCCTVRQAHGPACYAKV